MIEYEREGEPRFVATASIPGTPWIAAYELPHAAVFRPVRRSVMRLGVIAAGSIVIGAAGAWLLSRRLTSPLRELMGAVGAIAAGDHERRVRVERADELGQLGTAFNAMADRVTEGRATLEAKVEDRTRALRVANVELARREQERTVLYERLSELDRLKTEFFVNVSHELRTPLTLVLSPIRKLLAGDGLSAEQRAELETVRRSATLLLKHVDDLLDVTKLEAGRVEIAYAELDLAALVRWIASNFGSLASERGIAYDVRAPETLVAEVDPDKVQRILVNLLSNALKFTPRGGAVQCGLQSANGHAVLMVSDSGPGIARELRERVFERFYQTAASSRVRGGTGLGLTIAREIAQLHDGSIRIEEAETGGALVIVELPLRAPEGAEVARGEQPERELDERVLLELAPRPAAPERESALEAGAPLVLVVEDNRAMNAFLVQALSSEFRVLSAFDGSEGVRIAAESAPDLIVTDVMMPRMDGEELIGAVRARAGIEDTPILVITARADDETRARLIRAGAQDCLGKPFLTEEVLARAGALVEGRRRAEAALRERNRLLRAATEGLTDAVFVKDRRSCYLALNSAAARLLGHAADDVVGKDDTQLMPPEFAHATMALEREIMAGGRSVTYEFELDSRGARRTLLMTKGPYRDEDGRTIGVVGVCRDITERKQAEEALRETNCALLGANEDLEHLVHALSHDLQEPLRMVAIYAQLLRKKYGGRLDAEADESIGFVIGSAERMHQLLQGILAYSRLDPGARETVRACEASSALQQALLNLDASVREHRAVVTSSALPRVRVQETHLLQLFQNLVGNAIKFHGDEPPRVHVSAERSGAKWLFSVRDNGIGIEPQYADRVFRIFKRLHGREFQGAGIGLAICKRIVERYGGEIWVESEPRRGACFRFTAPPE